jgi:NADH-quinone oxidoreductase subunit H
LPKESVIPSAGNKFIFVIAPGITFFLSLIGWAVIPFSSQNLMADIDLGVIYIFAISSLGVYGIVMSGWASNSKYAFFGSTPVCGSNDKL